jgi:hypothetical protein
VSSALAEASQINAESAPEAPPGHRCLLHRPPRDGRSWTRPDPGYRTCGACLARVRERLAEVCARWEVLDSRPGCLGEESGPRPPGFGPRSPASDVVIVMRDWRSVRTAIRWLDGNRRTVHRESARPPLSVLAELHTLARHVADARDLVGPVRLTVAEIVRWLDGQLDWVTRQPGVVEFDRVIRELVSQLRPLTGEPRARRVGQCPNVIDEGEHTRECATPLYAHLHQGPDSVIRCSGCRRVWARGDWLQLGRMLQTA